MIRVLLFLLAATPALACQVLPCPNCGTTTTNPVTTTVTTTSTSTSTTPTTLPPGGFFIDNSCVNNGDGTTNLCAATPGGAGAWNALDNLVCGTFVAPDSTIFVRSRGGTVRSRRYLGRWHALENAQCAGTLGHPLVVENYPHEDVVTQGTTDIHGNTWTDRGSGIWECTSGTDCGPPGANEVYFSAWYTKASIASGAEQQMVLVNPNVLSCATSGLAANQMANLTGAAGHLCVRLADDSSPITTDYFDVPRTTDFFEGVNGVFQNYITIRQHPSGGSWTTQRYRNNLFVMSDAANVGWVFDGLNVGYNDDRCIAWTGSGTPNATIINNTVRYCGQEGIRLEGVNGGTSLIQHNDVGFTQANSLFKSCIGHCRKSFDNGTGIRLAVVSGVSVINNTVHDQDQGANGRNRGIDLEGGGTGNLLDGNYLYNLSSIEDHGDNQQATGAINFSSTGASTQDWGGNTLRNNRMYNVEECYRFQADAPTALMTPSLFQNNTCVNSKFAAIEVYGAGTFDATTPFVWKNDIFAQFGTTTSVRTFLHVPAGHGTAWNPSTMTFNNYYCQACSSGTQIITINGSNANANNTSVVAFDPNSNYGDPELNLVASPPTLQIINTGGAYSLATPISPAFPDFEGDLRPQTQGWDIGADEALGTTQTSTTSSTSTTTSTVTTTSTSTTTGVVTTTTTSTTTTTLVTPVQVLQGGGFTAPSTSAATRAGLAGSQWSTDTDQKTEQLIPTNGIVGGLRMLAQVDPGGSATWTAALLKNEALTGLTCTISAGATACHDTTNAHNVTFAPGDRVAIRLTPANTPASGAIQVSTLWQPTTTDETIWPSSLGNDIANATAYEVPLNTRSVGNTRDGLAPSAGAVKSLYAWTNTAVVTGASRIFTVQQNDVDTSLSCTVVQGTNTCNDTNGAHAITVAAGDKIRTVVTITGTPLGQPLASGVIFVPSLTTSFVAGMNLLQAPPTTATDEFTPLNGAFIGTNLTTENLLAQSVGQAMTFKNIFVKLAGNTGASSTLAVTLRKNGSSTALTCSMTNAATCNLTTDVTAVNDDLLGTLWHHTGSAGVSQDAEVSYSAIFTGTFP